MNSIHHRRLTQFLLTLQPVFLFTATPSAVMSCAKTAFRPACGHVASLSSRRCRAQRRLLIMIKD
ncbi:hypothetical protein BA187_01935 [Serratia marcescens]|nr:hypothetical protein BA187_01935 [Serratia marcescens]